jgi:hypothetical protein
VQEGGSAGCPDAVASQAFVGSAWRACDPSLDGGTSTSTEAGDGAASVLAADGPADQAVGEGQGGGGGSAGAGFGSGAILGSLLNDLLAGRKRR